MRENIVKRIAACGNFVQNQIGCEAMKGRLLVIAGLLACFEGCYSVPIASKPGVSVVDDNYCDTADGNDEPSTSACSHVRNVTFACKTSNSWTVSVIPSSRVNDGIGGSVECQSNVIIT